LWDFDVRAFHAFAGRVARGRNAQNLMRLIRLAVGILGEEGRAVRGHVAERDNRVTHSILS
jgi:hypothetical protein